MHDAVCRLVRIRKDRKRVRAFEEVQFNVESLRPKSHDEYWGIGRTGDMFTLRFRDYPKLPKFVRHRNVVLMSPSAE